MTDSASLVVKTANETNNRLTQSIPTCTHQHLGPVQTANFTCAEPNTCLGPPKLVSSNVDSDGRTLHVPNLTRGEKKYHPYCLK